MINEKIYFYGTREVHGYNIMPNIDKTCEYLKK